MCHSWTRQINNSRGFSVVIGHPSYSVNTPGVKLHIQSAGSWVFLQVKMVETTTPIREASTENPQLENEFTPLSQKACFWGFLLPAIFSLCPSIFQMQTISRRAVTLPASKKKRPFQTLEGDEKIGGESLESDRALSVDPAASLKRICGCDWWGEGAARTRGCVMYSGGLEGGLIALSWADSGQMRRGGGRVSAITQHSSFLSVLFLLKGAESPISAKLEQEFKKKFIKRNCKTAKCSLNSVQEALR